MQTDRCSVVGVAYKGCVCLQIQVKAYVHRQMFKSDVRCQVRPGVQTKGYANNRS